MHYLMTMHVLDCITYRVKKPFHDFLLPNASFIDIIEERSIFRVLKN